jgi:hypothetical protein
MLSANCSIYRPHFCTPQIGILEDATEQECKVSDRLSSIHAETRPKNGH